MKMKPFGSFGLEERFGARVPFGRRSLPDNGPGLAAGTGHLSGMVCQACSGGRAGRLAVRLTGRETMAMQTKKRGWRHVAMAGAAALGMAGLPGAAGADDDTARIKQGYAIAPVKLNVGNRNRALIGLGSYIVNGVGGCNDCHTNPPYAPGGDPFQGQPTKVNTKGYLAGGNQFGPFTSPNLTPYKNGRPAGLSYSAFRQAMRTGHDPDGGGILQVMPWPVYKNMIERDLLAIYVYLHSIPAIKPSSGK
ncbi:MAG TPA: hypothetical protein VHL31_00155 [Geminicoccus sp.]|jgi:hypothetical protein|uniref:hypothetical protein n=1 Tax=Geminicoccus sp. TaxID=2024832 RepID=UPI002E36CC5B|nr:hypothetical protein [Geminicoccus sp.]HEX2524705.1 hypothetical protein [Geminicoccus sp.]